MTFNDLPEDLVVEILSRVPAVSLARLRSTSKYWNALIKDGRVLAKKHFAYAPRQPRALVLIDNRVYSVKLNLQEIQNNLAPWQTYSQVREEEDCYALGKSSCNKYKILRQDHLIDPSQERYVTKITWEDIINSRQDRYEHEIYDFTSNSWRGLGVTTDLFIPEEIYRGTSVNGITYWCDINKESLVSFDFSTERFRSEPIPEGESPLALSVTEQGQQLCMLSTHSTCVMETNVNLWIATKSVNTGAMSWIKFPIFQGTGLRYRHHFREWVSFFAHQKNEKYVVVSCHRTNRHSQNIIHIVVDGKFIEMGHHGA
ncbi:hypothetical protein CARUB_v10015966mg [Capsella rubella]|uniref:F-box domain-containing protein n=1 Tax=Capsella rubella TaxID=81985 RepID=R0HS93_9BRAS|nr:hypothetical protein CARUB_v10015966mg [Capsella rubella]